MLNLAMAHQTPRSLSTDTAPWTLAGLILVICSGLLIYSTDPDMYYLNLPFLLKMGFFGVGDRFSLCDSPQIGLVERPFAKSKVAACISLAFVGGGGLRRIFMGFTAPDLSL